MKLPFILASQSPRRRELMGYFSVPFEQRTPPYDEALLPFRGDPEEYVSLLAQGKAASLAPSYPEQVILAADTIVYKEGVLYGKPTDDADAEHMLRELSGSWHSVYTGVTVRLGESVYSDVAETRVLFRNLSPEERALYQKAIHGADKAGSYAIQRAGELVIERIEGCYSNVVGLPLSVVQQLFQRVGIDLWHSIDY